ncbi:MAG: AMP-binding protein, partial [Gammaproteobacteria bacterium]|nr:AMP-binding protein [Gammaproteobacteria bacterium]
MQLLHELVLETARKFPDSTALDYQESLTSYGQLASQLGCVSGGLIRNGLQTGDRVAVYLAKQPEAVVSFFATTLAAGVFVPVNPQLKSAQVAHILADSGARFLITTAARARSLQAVLTSLTDLKIVFIDEYDDALPGTLPWTALIEGDQQHRDVHEDALAALLYTSGSTGRPKGVMLSHQNLVCGAKSVSSYLNNTADDKLLTVLPFSFDYGFSQLSTAFYVGAQVVLFDYLLPRDV